MAPDLGLDQRIPPTKESTASPGAESPSPHFTLRPGHIKEKDTQPQLRVILMVNIKQPQIPQVVQSTKESSCSAQPSFTLSRGGVCPTHLTKHNHLFPQGAGCDGVLGSSSHVDKVCLQLCEMRAWAQEQPEALQDTHQP